VHLIGLIIRKFVVLKYMHACLHVYMFVLHILMKRSLQPRYFYTSANSEISSLPCWERKSQSIE